MNRIVCFLLIVLSSSTTAQELYQPRNVRRAYANGTRSADGNPGKNYWQNRARYTINIQAAPPNRTIQGTEEITYINNSPNELKTLVLKVFMNMHKPNASRMRDVSPDYLTKGVTIESITSNGSPLKFSNDFTILPVTLNQPLASKDSVRLTIKWNYDASQQSGREGMIDSTTFFLAYFYPRIAVYDDYRGWDVTPFVDYQEFYNDFNDYTLNVRVPRHYVVWATGTLTNPNEVLQPAISERYRQSLRSDDVIRIVSPKEINDKSATVNNEFNTWQFTSSNVTDVAVGFSDHYVWDAGSVVVDKSTGRRASMQAAYNDTAKDYHHMVRFGKDILHWLSTEWPGIPYPYEKSVVFQGYAGMEYPMMANDESYEDTTFSKFVAFHELAHTYMPFYMCTNETQYGFMDEGWATAFEFLYNRSWMDSARAAEFFKLFRVQNWTGNPLQEMDLPIITPGSNLVGLALGSNQYGKPALGYLALKDMLGDKVFKQALHRYMKIWSGKHPNPWDFFNIFNTATGQNLNWFWNSWFFSPGHIDFTLKNVKTSPGSVTLSIENTGGMPAPFDALLTYADGSSERFHQSPLNWQKKNKEINIVLKARKAIQSVTLDGGIFMDATPANNRWEKK